MTSDVVIGSRFQGPTGSGQGGWTAHRFVAAVGRPLDVSIRAPIPLDTALTVEPDADGGWRLSAPLAEGRATSPVMTGVPRGPLDLTTEPVSIEQAARARARFGDLVPEHPVPECFSCGLRPHSMRVQAAPLHDGSDRYATDWTVPDWATKTRAAGGVDEGVAWAALDCTAAWFACTSRGIRNAVTAQYAVDVVGTLEVGATYALVSWSGDGDVDWNGRKRVAASVAFAADGSCVARARSLWVSID